MRSHWLQRQTDSQPDRKTDRERERERVRQPSSTALAKETVFSYFCGSTSMGHLVLV